jgi:hypothetical protein
MNLLGIFDILHYTVHSSCMSKYFIKPFGNYTNPVELVNAGKVNFVYIVSEFQRKMVEEKSSSLAYESVCSARKISY